jgi:predicted MFS family arabinose efflux permease
MAKLPSITHPTVSARPAVAAQPLLIMLQVAAFIVAAEARMIAALLPALASDLHSTIAGTGLLITVYALPYGLSQLIYGPLADRFSHQRVLAVALGLFALGTLCSGLAPNMTVLLVLRVCTGAAAAGVIPVTLAYIGDTVPYAER